MTWRQLRKLVLKAGGTLVSGGPFETWRLPNGQLVKLDAKHRNQQVRTSVLKLILKNLAECGVTP